MNFCSKGFYKIIAAPSTEKMGNRLLEIGFRPNQHIYIICNNILGIQVRIRNVVYMFNEAIASTIYLEPVEE